MNGKEILNKLLENKFTKFVRSDSAPLKKLKDGFEWVQFGEIFKLIPGTQPPKSTFVYSETEGYIRMLQIRDFKSENHKTFIPISNKNKLCEETDILIGRYGSVGTICTGKSGSYNVALMKLDFSKELIHRDWALYLLQSPELKMFYGSTNRTAIAGFNQDEIYKLWIPLPPLEEQIRIAQRLEEAERQSLSIQSESDRLLQDISDFRQEILTRAFRGDLTEQNFDEGTGQDLLKQIQLEREQEQTVKRKKKVELKAVEAEEEPYELPPNWTWTQLGEVADIKHGYAFKGDFFSDSKTSRILMTPGNISNRGEYLTNKNRYYDDSVDINRDFLLSEGDLVMNLTDLTRDCNTLGKCVFIPKYQQEVLHNQRLGLVKTLKYNQKLFYYFSLSESYFSQIIKSATGTTVRHTSPIKVLNFLTPLPPLAEQERIVAKIEAIFSALDVMEDAIKKQKDEAKSCYEEILRKEMGNGEKEPGKTSEEKDVVTVA